MPSQNLSQTTTHTEGMQEKLVLYLHDGALLSYFFAGNPISKSALNRDMWVNAGQDENFVIKLPGPMDK